jgi:hypothetical protein
LHSKAIHIPVQAPAEFTDNYKGVYDAGGDELREQRIRTAREKGLMPHNAPAPEPHPTLRAWTELSEAEQTNYVRSMMVNAGMLEAMDHHIGRLLAYLESEALLSDTVFIITSDNGPEFGDPSSSAAFRLWMSINDYHTKGFQDEHFPGAFDYLECAAPEQSWIINDSFGIADISLAAPVRLLDLAGAPLDASHWPLFEAYYRRIIDRQPAQSIYAAELSATEVLRTTGNAPT